MLEIEIYKEALFVSYFTKVMSRMCILCTSTTPLSKVSMSLWNRNYDREADFFQVTQVNTDTEKNLSWDLAFKYF